MRAILTLLIGGMTMTAVPVFAQVDQCMSKATREDKAGWIYVHLEGSPREIGYQHGYMLAGEIDDLIQTMKSFLLHSSGKDWDFYRDAARNMFWEQGRLGNTRKRLLGGIVDGLKAKG